MRKCLFTIALYLLVFLFGAGLSMAADGTGNLTVRINGLRNENGVVWVLLFNSRESYPKPEKAYLILQAEMDGEGGAEAVFTDLPFGEYAVHVLHDENQNQAADFNNDGIPTEGIGVSRNGHPLVFDSSCFSFDGDTEIEIQVRYLQ